ncbi:MAG: YebC/PmpR family DNA-binding transcriptional regulator [Acholeplasmatales bacterium]|nr:YebC/PmpR family DNA-binding transcriptional regulator [Acholeplasmatales bacterium]
MGRAHEVRAASMAKTAAMKSSKYAKWQKEIFAAAKAGVPDPDMNQGLKNVIARAKKEQVPADVIKRAIEKAAGVKSGATKEKSYEGMGPGNVAVIVNCLTDNDNRTFTEVRTAFNKTGGTIGQAVSYLFSKKAIFEFEGMSEDEVLEALMMGENTDYEDLTVDEDGFVKIVAVPESFEGIKAAILAAKPDLEFETASCEMVPSSYVDLDEDHLGKFKRLLEALAEFDDVDEVIHNANLPAEDEE